MNSNQLQLDHSQYVYSNDRWQRWIQESYSCARETCTCYFCIIQDCININENLSRLCGSNYQIYFYIYTYIYACKHVWIFAYMCVCVYIYIHFMKNWYWKNIWYVPNVGQSWNNGGLSFTWLYKICSRFGHKVAVLT